jgi:hypothetical protein
MKNGEMFERIFSGRHALGTPSVLLTRIFLLFLIGVAGCRSEKIPSAPAEFSAAWIIPSETAPEEIFYLGEREGWADRFAEALGLPPEKIRGVPAFESDGMPTAGATSAWTRDEWIFARSLSDDAPRVLLPAGERPLREWVIKHFTEKNLLPKEIGEPREYPQRRFDDGGNLLASPPIPGKHLYGRLVVGRDLQASIKTYFKQQGRQTDDKGRLLELETAWLRIGHVDEIVGFVPVKEKPGFRVVVPDAKASLRLLAGLPDNRVLFHAGGKEADGEVAAAGARFVENKTGAFPAGNWKYLRIVSGKRAGLVGRVRGVAGNRVIIDHVWDLRGPSPSEAVRCAREGRCDSMPIWFEPPAAGERWVAVEFSQMWLDGAGDEFPAFITVGELRTDQALKDAAEFCVKKIFGKNGAWPTLRKGLRLTDADVLSLPVLFYGNAQNKSEMTALTPNPINLLNANGSVFFLIPFGPRANPADENSDVFLREWRARFSELGLRTSAVDGWDAMHRVWGGVHCGVNVLRKLP